VAAATRFFSEEATAALTRFVFYFALSAMIFRFSANLSFRRGLRPAFLGVYFWATAFVYLIANSVALARGMSMSVAAVEAQCAVIGNIGFLGVPMLALLLGEQAVGYIMMMLAVDLLIFGSLIVIVILVSREGRVSLGMFRTVGKGLVTNPMLVAIFAGLHLLGAGDPDPGAGQRVPGDPRRRRHPRARCSPSAPRWPPNRPSGCRHGVAVVQQAGAAPGLHRALALVIWPGRTLPAAVMIASAAPCRWRAMSSSSRSITALRHTRLGDDPRVDGGGGGDGVACHRLGRALAPPGP
jgi:malonate transporter